MIQGFTADGLNGLIHQLVTRTLQQVTKASDTAGALELATLRCVHRLPGGIRVFLMLESALEGGID